MTAAALKAATRRADEAEKSGICRYLSARSLAQAAATAEKRADANMRLEIALSLGR